VVAAEVGMFAGRLPHVRIETGGPPLVVLPGMALTAADPRGLTLNAYAHGFRRLAERNTVYVVPARAAWLPAPPPRTSPRRTRTSCGPRWASSR
jgi:hypothetical protein